MIKIKALKKTREWSLSFYQ